MTHVIRSGCSGCGLCAEACPTVAVVETEGLPFRIDCDQCVECGVCVEECPLDVIAVVGGTAHG